MSLKDNLEPEKIKAYLEYLKTKGKSRLTIRRKEIALRRFFEWAKKEKLILPPPPAKTKFSFGKKIFPFPEQIKAVFFSIPLYFKTSAIALLTVALGIFIYDQFIKRAPEELAYPSGLTSPSRVLSFQGRLTDDQDTPITDSTNFVFTLYDDETGGSALWTSNSCAIDPDEDGIFSVRLGATSGADACGPAITADVFTENVGVWLKVTVAGEDLSPRQPIATSAYALNSETLQGFPPGTGTSNILYINSSGSIDIGVTSPSLDASTSTGTFAIKGESLLLQTPDASDGDIGINPDGEGVLDLIFEGSAPSSAYANDGVGGFVTATNANIASGALYFGEVASDATDYDFLQFKSGASPSEKFSIDASGNTYTAGNLEIGGTATIGNIPLVSDNNRVLTSSGAGSGDLQYIDTSSWDKDGGDDFGAWILAGDSGTPQSIGSGNTATLAGGIGIGTTASATDTLTIDVDQSYAFGWTGSQTWSGTGTFNNTLSGTSTVNFTGLGTGTDDTVLILDSSNNVTTDEIDSRVWGSSLVDYSSSNANYIPKFSDSETITNSIIYESSSKIGIGTTGPGQLLELGTSSGDPAISFDIGGTDKFVLGIDDSANDIFVIETGGTVGASTTPPFVITSGGNVGIGTTGPGDRLVVAGNIDPSADNSYDLGDTTNQWQNIYTQGSIYLAGGTTYYAGDSDGDGYFRTIGVGSVPQTDATTYSYRNEAGNSDYYYGIKSSIYYSGSTADAEVGTRYHGIYGAAHQNSTYAIKDNRGLVGVLGGTILANTGAVSHATGVLGAVDASYSGTVTLTNGYGVKSTAWVASGTTADVTNLYSFYASAPTAAGIWNISNHYGLYLGAIDDGTSQNYGIFAESGDWVLDNDGDGIAGGTGPGGDLVLGEGQDLRLYHDGNNSYITNYTGNLYIGDTATDSLILQANGGNVGIGTTDPGYKLEVNGAGYVSGNLGIGGTANIGNIPLVSDNNRVLTSASAGSGAVQYLDTSSWDKNSSDDYSSWILAGDSGTPQSIATGNTANILGGAGITSSASNTDTLTLTFASTELGSLTWGSGSPFTWTLDVGATDPYIYSTSNILALMNGNIGIGTTNPGKKVEISSSDVQLRLRNGSTIGEFFVDSSHLYLSNDYGTSDHIARFAHSTASVSEIYSGLEVVQTTDNKIEDALVVKHLSATANSWKTAGFGTGIDLKTGDSGTPNNELANIYSMIASFTDVDNFDTRLYFKTRKTATLAEAMTIDENGNVGIGTTVPGSKLDVVGTITLENDEQIVNSTDDYITFQGAAGANDTDLRIDLDGNYPILDSPTDSIIGFNEAVYVLNSQVLRTYGTGGVTYLELYHDASNAYIHSQAGDLIFRADNDTNDYIYLSTEGNVPVIRTAGTAELAIIPDAGNVGIGTTDPLTNFHVEGIGYFTDEVQAGASGGLSDVAFTWRTDQDTGMYSPNANELGLVVGATEAIRIGSSAYVGIGNTAPTKRLDVSGDIRLTGSFYDTNVTGGIALGDGSNTALDDDFTAASIIGALNELIRGPVISLTWGDAGTHIDNDWYRIHNGTATSTGYELPYAGTIETLTARCDTAPSAEDNVEIYVDGAPESVCTGTISTSTGDVIQDCGSSSFSAGSYISVQADLPSGGSGNNCQIVVILRFNSVDYDLAEYFPTQDLGIEWGDVVEINRQHPENIQKSSQLNSDGLLGVISTQPSVIMGQWAPDRKPVALSGRVPVKISPFSDPILAGDFLTSSSEPGLAQKSTRPGLVLGKALEPWTPESGKKKIIVFVDVHWYDPDVYLTEAGDLKIEGFYQYDHPQFTLKNKAGELISRIGAFSQVVAAKIRAGLIETQDLIVKKKIVSPLAEVKEIKELEKISSQETLIFENQEGEPIMALDQEKKVSIFGQLLTQEAVIEGDATVSGTLYAQEVVTEKGSFGEIVSQKIASVRGELEELIIRQKQEKEAISGSPLAYQAQEWETNVSQTQINSWPIDQGQLTAETILASQLIVEGKITAEEAFINQHLFVGNIALTENAISTLGETLYLQPSGEGKIDLLAGTVIIETTGGVTINADLAVKGGIRADEYSGSDGNITLALGGASFSGFGSLLVKGEDEKTVASINASGSAQFSGDLIASGSATFDKINVAPGPVEPILADSRFGEFATDSAKLKTNATAGQGSIPSGKNEVIIYTGKLTSDSLVYLTPITETKNQVLFVKNKFVSEDQGKSHFTVSVSEKLTQEIKFNWWLIN